MQNYLSTLSSRPKGNSKFKIVFFGSSEYVIPIIRTLQENFDLKLVITTERNPTNAVPTYCIKNKISYESVSNPSDPDLKLKIENLPFGFAQGGKLKIAVLADFGLIIPQSILNMFPMGIINIHPSLLPKYRGPTPVQTAILNGEETTGVSIMKLDEEIDHGPILAQEKEEILSTDTSETLYKRLFAKGANLLLKVLPKYLNGSLKPIPQNHIKTTFTDRLTRQSGYLDISNVSTTVGKIERIERMIRAHYPWPGVWTRIKIKDKGLRIKFLPGQKIQVEGKKPVNYKDFLNGYPQIRPQLKELLEQLA